MDWKNLYRGAVMGAVEGIPGISAGTIAILLGIYERLIESINGFFSKSWRKQLGFLIPLGIGMVISLFAIARVITWLYSNHPTPTQFFFMGLILGVLPFLLHKADAKNKFKGKHIGFMLAGAAIVSVMGFFSPAEGEIITNLTPPTYLLLFFSGIIASSALILPGVSGSFMLLTLGVYPTVMAAVSTIQMNILLVTGTGIIIGFVVMSRIIGYFLRNHFTLTFATTTGLVIGSMFVLFPGFSMSMGIVVISIIAFFAGLILAIMLGRIEYR